MPESRAQHKPGEVCPRCQVVHLTPSGTPACVGHSKTGSGKACRRAPVDGQTVCVTHGAHAPQNVAAAEKRIAVAEATRQLAKMGIAIDTDPLDALLHQVWEAAGNVEFLRETVRDLERLTQWSPIGAMPDAHVKLYNEERDRLAKFSEMALRAGVAERQVRIVEQQGVLFADLLRKVLDDPSLGLSETQRKTARKVAAGHLRLLSAS